MPVAVAPDEAAFKLLYQYGVVRILAGPGVDDAATKLLAASLVPLSPQPTEEEWRKRGKEATADYLRAFERFSAEANNELHSQARSVQPSL